MTLDPFNLPEQLNLTEVFLYAQAKKHPDKTAIFYRDQTISYGQLCAQVDRATALYKKLGLQQEQRAILMLPDLPQFACAWFGVVKAGGVVSAVSPDLKPDEVAYYLDYTRAQILICHASTLPALEQVRAERKHLKHVLVVGGPAGKHLDYDAELAQVTPDPTFAATHRDDAAVWLYTSGSTGFPKGAVHKHHDFVFNALTYGLPIAGYGPDDRCFSVPRLAFGYALGTNLLFPLLSGGATVLFEERPTPEKIFEVIQKYKPTFFTGVPTALNGILNAPGVEKVDFSGIRVALSAGEALPGELYLKWKERTKIEVLDGIGSAEMFHIFITNRVGDVKVGSLGRVVEGYRAKICDDEGREVPTGEIGTLWVQGDSMALEYWQNHEKSKSTFRGDWCVSADKFLVDEQGYFFFCGRGDDMLKVGGKWLAPVEVENELLKHPSVREAAIVAFKDADGLDKPKAFVALKDGFKASEALGEEIKAMVRAALAPYKAPRKVVFLDALPRSDRGKVLKGQLRE